MPISNTIRGSKAPAMVYEYMIAEVEGPRTRRQILLLVNEAINQP